LNRQNELIITCFEPENCMYRDDDYHCIKPEFPIDVNTGRCYWQVMLNIVRYRAGLMAEGKIKDIAR